LFLSDKIRGFFMCPDNTLWNYNFIGLGMVNSAKYALVLANPKDFYNEVHRVSHFIKFNRSNEEEDNQEFVDNENLFE